jgi:hypothetical protein
MDIPVTIASGTPFDSNLGEESILTIVFTTQEAITYKEGTTLYFYAEITEDLLEQTVCFPLSGGANPLPIGSTSFTIENTEGFTDEAEATGKIYYTPA